MREEVKYRADAFRPLNVDLLSLSWTFSNAMLTGGDQNVWVEQKCMGQTLDPQTLQCHWQDDVIKGARILVE